MIDWVIENVQWIFSGIGVAIITAVVGFAIRRKRAGIPSQQIRSAEGSTNIQAGGDVRLSIDQPAIQKQSDNEVPLLEPPVTDIAHPIDDSDSPLRVRRILEGRALDSASRVFDIILANPSKVQVMLTEFDVRWRYYRGMEEAIDEGVALEPVAKYVIELPIDPDDPREIQKIDTIYPIIIVPPRNESGPSITTFRIQLHYALIGWHPCYDWNIVFSLAVRDDKGGTLQLFSNSLWRSSQWDQYILGT